MAIKVIYRRVYLYAYSHPNLTPFTSHNHLTPPTPTTNKSLNDSVSLDNISTSHSVILLWDVMILFEILDHQFKTRSKSSMRQFDCCVYKLAQMNEKLTCFFLYSFIFLVVVALLFTVLIMHPGIWISLESKRFSGKLHHMSLQFLRFLI